MDCSQWPRFCRTDWRMVCLIVAIMFCGLSALVGCLIGHFNEAGLVAGLGVMALMVASVVLEFIASAIILRKINRGPHNFDGTKEEVKS